MTICIEVAVGTDDELDDEIMLEIEKFNQKRQKERNCLPLTDYEKLLLREFMKGLIV